MSVNATTRPLPPDQLALEALSQARDTHRDTHKLLCELRDQLGAPADYRTVDLSATSPLEVISGSGKSIGVLNPSAVVVYLGVGGGSARVGARGVPVPPTSLLVWPAGVRNPEIGVDPADSELGSSTVVLHVLLFATVQPAFLGSI